MQATLTNAKAADEGARQRGHDNAKKLWVRAALYIIPSFYRSSCASNGKGALNTPECGPVY
eukprot:7909513-Pyramimonas_sp.AAC.1